MSSVQTEQQLLVPAGMWAVDPVHSQIAFADISSADMLDVERFPAIRFTSTAVEHVEGERFRVRGELTVKETPIPVELEARLRGTGTDAWGNEKIAIRFDGAIEWGPTRVELTAEISAA